MDRSGDTSVQTSFKLRASWARGDWMRTCSGVFASFSDPVRLARWGVLRRSVDRGGSCAGGRLGGCRGHGSSRPNGQDAQVIDAFLMETMEALARNFVGVHTRNLILWSGGIYHTALMLSGNLLDEQAVFDRAHRVWVKLTRLEELLFATAAAAQAVVAGEAMEVKSNADRPSAALCHDLLAFEQDFLWKDGTVYRELMAAMSGGRRAFSREYVHRLHSSIVHEEGIASMC